MDDNRLLPSLEQLIESLNDKVTEFKDINKVVRTHLQDAVPITLGQEFSSYVSQLKTIKQQIDQFTILLTKLPVGGTAVGTGINTHMNLRILVFIHLRANMSNIKLEIKFIVEMNFFKII